MKKYKPSNPYVRFIRAIFIDNTIDNILFTHFGVYMGSDKKWHKDKSILKLFGNL